MSWIKHWSASESINFLTGLSHQCALLGGPMSRKLHEHVINREYREVIDFKIDYNEGVSDCLYSRQIQALFSKAKYLDLGVDVEAVALEKFLEAEAKCLSTNIRLRNEPPTSGVAACIMHAQRKIAHVLGTLPSLDMLDFAFGPGVTTSTKQDATFPRGKLSSRLECTESLLPIVGDLLAEVPVWTSLHSKSEDEESFSVDVAVTIGKLAFVPKTALTKRSIVVEPILNGFYQKGFGSYLKRRLRKHGIDLSDQTRNQRLACVGSLEGSLATIDLSSASDTIASELVWQLLPVDWACALWHGRSEAVQLPGPGERMLRLHKFSSMGNAYTFELESLIFYSLAFGCCIYLGIDFRDRLSVYGDDIILPVEAYELLSEVLDYCGFEVNSKKSFATGAFRESCGADFLRGIDIRPFYQKDLVSERTLYVMHNWFLRHAEPELAKYVYAHTRPDIRLHGPDGYGDGHLIGDYTLRQNREARRRGWEGGYFDTYTLKPRRRIEALPGDAVLPVYSIYVSDGESYQDHDVIRGTCGYQKQSIYTLATSVFRRVLAA